MSRNAKFDEGDTFAVPLGDGTYGLGQVCSIATMSLGAPLFSYFSARGNLRQLEEVTIDVAQMIAVELTTLELINSGVWKLIGKKPVICIKSYVDVQQMVRVRLVGSKIQGAGVMRMFLEAYHGLRGWRSMHDPETFNRMLVGAHSGPSFSSVVNEAKD